MVSHDKPQGLTASLIQSYRQAKGSFIARQDADDWSGQTRLEEQIAILGTNLKLAAIGSPFALYFPDGRYLDTIKIPKHALAIRRLLRHRNPLAHGSLIFRRTMYEQVGGYRPQFRYAQDYDLLLRLSEIGDIGATETTLYHHRLSSGGIGRTKMAQQQSYADLARSCAKVRKKGGDENFLFEHFREPDTTTPSSGTVDPILLHLIKSGQRKAATEQLTRWLPRNAKERMVKRGLSLLNVSPAPIRRVLHSAYRLWLLR